MPEPSYEVFFFFFFFYEVITAQNENSLNSLSSSLSLSRARSHVFSLILYEYLRQVLQVAYVSIVALGMGWNLLQVLSD